MRRALGWGFLILLVCASVGAIWIYQQVTALRNEQVTDDVFALFGFGGNVGVLRTDEGGVVVDTMTFRIQGEEVRQRAEDLVGGPIQYVFNTHYHLDHAHGNPAFSAGLPTVATQRTRSLMLSLDSDYWSGANAEHLPNKTFSDRYEVATGGKTVRALHLGPGHTGGDLVVLFQEDRVLHAGDLFFNRIYPNIDLEAGGTVRGWITTLDRVLELEFDHVIPGHGELSDREGLAQFQRFLRELWSVGERAAAEGWTLSETLSRADLREDEGYATLGVPGVFRLDRDFVVRRVWEEATGAVESPGSRGPQDLHPSGQSGDSSKASGEEAPAK